MSANDYQLVEQAIRFLDRNAGRQPELREVAASVGLSEFHFQRLFQRWAGVSPKRFLQFQTAQEAKRVLRESGDLLDASYNAGLSGPGRLHDLIVNVEAVTPGEYKRRGGGLSISWGTHATPFGDCLLGLTPRGVCALEFLQPESDDDALARLRTLWENAQLVHAPQLTAPVAERIFGLHKQGLAPLAVLVKGTNFQIKVWEALLRVPSGEITSYARLARNVGQPRAARAVGSAVAANPIAYLIPCHRVIRSTGSFGDYRWGALRKRVLLSRELAQTEAA
ncbi:MAG: methylated-DNA--[protein]-cysteine S-methyltransferase [Burkholderiales bacterium]|nr:methylated-DNA--[protein]-cysteine S-methyltransferase [Burkholderiales bacterium]